MSRIFVILVLTLAPILSSAKGVYQTPQAFVVEVLGEPAPKPQLLWLDQTLRDDIRHIMGHDFARLRLRYWQQSSRTVWVLEEIGKEKPITVGIVVNAGAIERLKVLIFRESRGWEIRYPFFTGQFLGASLNGETRLNQQIDGISGATLSVRAVKKLATLALYLDRHLQQKAS